MPTTINIQRCRGLTLVELMVAVTISLFLLLGVVQVFMANKQTYRLQEAAAYVQESGRFADIFMAKDVRMVGYMGCMSSGEVPITNDLDIKKGPSINVSLIGDTFDGSGSLQGYTYDTTFPTDLAGFGLTSSEVVKGTDAILIKRANACSGGDVICHNNVSEDTASTKTCPGTIGNLNSAEYKIADNTECNIQQNDIVLITNCQTADIHGVTNTPNGSIHVTIAHGKNLNVSSKLTNSYGAGSSIMKISAELYYIGKGTNNEPALFRRSLQAGTFPAEELVPGVYDMTIEYGIDTDGDRIPNKYVPTASVTTAEWDEAVSARIRFDVRSQQDNVTTKSSTYAYDGANVTDRRLRKSFTTTIAFRNRV